MSLTKEVDVLELCALLQCLGFNVKSLGVTDENASSDNATRTIRITCQSSRLEVKLESVESACSCPPNAKNNNSGIWQVSGVTGGKHQMTESGCELIGSMPKIYQEKIKIELQNIIQCIKKYKSDEKSIETNRSASALELSASETRIKLKEDTPTRYRSLDTLLTSDDVATQCLNKEIVGTLKRQSTYTLNSTPENKTSSPIQRHKVPKNIIEKLDNANKYAEEVIKNISDIIKVLTEDTEKDTSYSGLDISKISVLKDTTSGHSFSSPNLPSLLKRSDNDMKLNRNENRASIKDEKGLPSRLRRLSPKFLKNKKNTDETSKVDKKPKENKFTNLFKPKVVAGPSTPKSSVISSNITSKKKICNIKSSIPKPTSAKPKE